MNKPPEGVLQETTTVNQLEVTALLGVLAEIARLRLATSEGSLRVRADRIWELATRTVSLSRQATPGGGFDESELDDSNHDDRDDPPPPVIAGADPPPAPGSERPDWRSTKGPLTARWRRVAHRATEDEDFDHHDQLVDAGNELAVRLEEAQQRLVMLTEENQALRERERQTFVAGWDARRGAADSTNPLPDAWDAYRRLSPSSTPEEPS